MARECLVVGHDCRHVTQKKMEEAGWGGKKMIYVSDLTAWHVDQGFGLGVAAIECLVVSHEYEDVDLR